MLGANRGQISATLLVFLGLELAAATLTDLLPEVVFVGGATVTLWITDPGAPPVRPTKDVDGLSGALRSDQASQDRADAVVLPALRAIASMR